MVKTVKVDHDRKSLRSHFSQEEDKVAAAIFPTKRAREIILESAGHQEEADSMEVVPLK